MSIPIVNLANLYHNGCATAWGSNTTLTVATGQVRDSTNVYDIVVKNTLTISTAAPGANGLDTGSIAANTGYFVFVISDPTNTVLPAGLLSLSSTAPAMPSVNGTTYGAFRLVGWVLTDGSSNLLAFYAFKGNAPSVMIQWATPITVLSAGAATSFAAVNLSVAAPKLATPVFLNIAYTPTTASSTASIRPTGSTAAAGSCPITLKGNVSAVSFGDNMVKILPQLSGGNASIDYQVISGDALTLRVAAFEMNF